MEFKDYYRILGVERSATAADVKKAYRKLARKFHPDVNPGDREGETRFREINEAYEVLGDEENRRKYDQLGARWKQAGPGGFQPGRGGAATVDFDLGDLLGGFESSGSDPRGFSSFFERFFGGGGFSTGRGARMSQAGGDLEATVEVSLEEAFQGTIRTLSVERPAPCMACAGRGLVGSSVCGACRGSGQVRTPQTLEVRIPAGVADGSKIRLRGQGDPGLGGGAAGDLFLNVRLAAHPDYEVRGHDLYREIPIPVYDAVLGGEVSFQGLRGTVTVKIPPETQNGRQFRLAGQGLPRSGDRPSGDLYVRVRITIPTGLSQEERELFHELAQRRRSA